MHPDFPNLSVIDHPLLKHKLTYLRREETSTSGFRRLVKEISQMLAFQAPPQFGRWFKNAAGLAPGKFRQGVLTCQQLP